MRTLPTITETVNELVLKIFSGVNYASKLAVETGKSVPVVFKQLEQLTVVHILEKARQGKRVVYMIRWDTVSSWLALIAQQELMLISKLMPGTFTKKTADELKVLSHELSALAPEKIAKTISAVFAIKSMQDTFSRLFATIDATARLTGKVAVDFREALGYFLDVFGALDEAEKLAYLHTVSLDKKSDLQTFFKISRLHYLLREITDPRIALGKLIKKNPRSE